MKSQKLLLDIEYEDEEITLGLVRLAKQVPDFEFFYHVNTLNSFKFSRISDFSFQGSYFDYQFPRFQAFHCDSKVCIQFIANRSCQSIQKKFSNELFSSENETKYLLEQYEDVDYLIRTSEPFDDFSLILLPEHLTFKTQGFRLSPEEEFYQLIQYYE